MTNLINTFLNRSIGFDPFFDGFDNWITPKSNFPFHNIKKESENKYIIEMALAGFGKEDIDVHQTDEILTIEASEHVKEEEAVYISKSITHPIEILTKNMTEFSKTNKISLQELYDLISCGKWDILGLVLIGYIIALKLYKSIM